MKKIIIIIFLMLLFCNMLVGTVTFYPGTEFLNDDLTVGFSNPDGITVTYAEFGDDYILFDEYNLSLVYSGAIEVNFSMYTEYDDLDSSHTTLMRFNVTHAAGNVKFYFNNSNSDNFHYNVYVDTVLTHSFDADFSFSYNGWSTHDYEIEGITGGGIVNITVYNESNFAQEISPFGLLISNQAGTETYQNYNCHSGHSINISEMPYGDNTIFLINATGYRDRIYYIDIAYNNTYNFEFYLPPIETEVEPGEGDDGGDNITTRTYTVHVIDQYFYPLGNVKVTIARYNNFTEEYVDVSSDVTDGNGDAQFNLIPEVLYRVTLEKDLYTQVGDPYWIPDPDYYGIYYPKQFQMEITESTVENVSFWDVCYFNGTMYNNDTLKVMFEEFSSHTVTNATFYTYEVYNFTESLNATNSTTNDSFIFWVTGINTSRVHRVVLYINHSNFGYVIVSIIINPLRSPLKTTQDIEDKTSGVFGDFDLGYVNFFLLFIPVIAMLVVFGPSHAGLGIIASGMYLGFASIFISVPSQVIYLIPVIIVFGVILVIVKRGRMGI